MTQEQKDLLFKDLCGRLPYGVKVQTTYINPQTKERKDIGTDVLSTIEISLLIDGYYEPKPYLFPFSSMTEDRKEEWKSLMEEDSFGILYHTLQSYDYLYKNHIDIRGLIPMGLAINATGKNIY